MSIISRSNQISYFSRHNPCTSCGRTKKRCYFWPDQDSIGCYYTDRHTPPAGYFAAQKQPRDGSVIFSRCSDKTALSPEQQHQRELDRLERDRNKKAFQVAELKNLLSAQDRDPLIRRLSAELGLSLAHQRILADRGLSPTQIKSGLFFSIGSYQKVPEWLPFACPGVYLSRYNDKLISHKVSGIAIVIFDQFGRATGWQLLNELSRPSSPDPDYQKYLWALNCHLPAPESRELPIQFTQPACSVDPRIWLCEGTLKPVLAAHRHNLITLGASSGNFAASPHYTEAALIGYDRVVLPIDAGDAINPDRVRHWQAQHDFLVSIGKRAMVGWWGQETKASRDIDEIADLSAIKFIEFAEWIEKSKMAIKKTEEIARYHDLNSCTLTPSELRSEQNLSALPVPRSGTIQLVTSPVATGKTKQLATSIDNWQRSNPHGRIFMLGYRNGLLDNAGDRLKIPSYRVGGGQDDFAIATYPKLRMCLDSLLRLKIEDVLPGSLVIFDEMDAILEHGSAGGTLGSNTPAIQAHLLLILNKILTTGGAIIGLEDGLTDLAINGLDSLLAGKYPIEFIKNTAERFNWRVKIGHGGKAQAIAHVLAAIARGETIAVPTSSRKFGQLLERIALAKYPELEGKIVLIDSFSQDKGELKSKPDEWLRDNETRLMIYTSAVESGFSIEQYKFDRVIAYLVNLTTRTHLQMLSRVRSDAPRDIFIGKRSAEASSVKSTNPDKLFVLDKNLAEQANLAHGEGRIETTPESLAWNKLIAKFKARANISYKHSQLLLLEDLAKRGHDVNLVDWKEVTDTPEELKELCDQTKEAIEREENHVLFTVDGRTISPAQAISIKHSSDSTFVQRQQAEKCLLHDRLPGVEFSEDFLLKSVTLNRSKYLNGCTLAFMANNPALAYQIDGEIIRAQREKQPHIIYSRVPRLSQKVGLLSEICGLIDRVIASGNQYQNTTPEVVRVQELAIAQSYSWWALFGITVTPASVDSKGRKKNTPVSFFNKVLKKLGYKNKIIFDTVKDGDRVKIYQIINVFCEHRSTIIEGLKNKYHEKLSAIAEGSDVKKTTTIAAKPQVEYSPEVADKMAIRDSLKCGLVGSLEERREARAVAIEVWGEAQVLAAAELLSFETKILFNNAV